MIPPSRFWNIGEKLVFVEAGYMPPETRRDISIIGDRGKPLLQFSEEFPLCSLKIATRNRGIDGWPWKGKPQEIPLPGGEPLKLELEASFSIRSRHRSRPLADGQAGLEALRIVEACYESSQRGRQVEIDWNKI